VEVNMTTNQEIFGSGEQCESDASGADAWCAVSNSLAYKARQPATRHPDHRTQMQGSEDTVWTLFSPHWSRFRNGDKANGKLELAAKLTMAAGGRSDDVFCEGRSPEHRLDEKERAGNRIVACPSNEYV
jgi:hypothetical protein